MKIMQKAANFINCGCVGDVFIPINILKTQYLIFKFVVGVDMLD